MSNWGIIIQSLIVLLSVFVGYVLATMNDEDE